MSLPGRELTSAIARFVVALAIVAVAVGGLGTLPVRAHTDVDFTLPTDGATVGEPVSEVSVGFTRPVTLIGPGFEVLDPQGNIGTPFVVTDDDQVFRLQLDPPLAGGEAAVRWEVRAEDGHTITGGFSFTISVDAVTTSVDATTTTSLPTSGSVETSTTSTSPVTSMATATSAPVSDDASQSTPTSAAPSETVDSPSEADSNGSSGVYVALAGAVVIGAAVFVALRSRVSASP